MYGRRRLIRANQFGGHAVFPSLARDMKRPQDFNRVCNIAFVVAAACYMFMGIIGYLMFGNGVSDEVRSCNMSNQPRAVLT